MSRAEQLARFDGDAGIRSDRALAERCPFALIAREYPARLDDRRHHSRRIPIPKPRVDHRFGTSSRHEQVAITVAPISRHFRALGQRAPTVTTIGPRAKALIR